MGGRVHFQTTPSPSTSAHSGLQGDFYLHPASTMKMNPYGAMAADGSHTYGLGQEEGKHWQ